jgi:hypothetical protein
MRSRVPALIAAAILALACGAQAQFLNLPQYDNGTDLSSFVQADVNGDSKADIIGINASSEITVLLNNGTGGFGASITTAMTGVDSPRSVFVLGDFNGDGHLDVAFFGKDRVTGQNAVAVMLGNGDGTFQAGKETTVGSIGAPENGSPCLANAGDYNGDGKLDIAYLNGNGGIVSLNVLPGKGDGTFSSPIAASLGSTFYVCLATGDFNNDKKLDLAIATNGGQIAMMLGKGDGTFQSPFGIGKAANPIMAAELKGDGNLDLVAVQESSSPSITVLLGDGTGHFPTEHTYNSNQGTALFPPVVQDLNGDGHPDLAFLTSFNHGPVVNILLNNGDGSFTPGRTYNGDGPDGAPVFGLFAADLNGDEKVDLAIGNGAGGISVLRGNGNGTFQGNFAVAGAPPHGFGLGIGKFTGSPALDLVAVGFPDRLLLSNGDGIFTAEKTSCNVEPATIADFNKDGKLDLAGPTTVGSAAVIGVCLGNGDGTFTVGGNFDQGITHRLALAGDFNNDGKLDLLASDQAGFSILLGNGDGTFQNGIPTAANATFPLLAFADLNNDGKLDVIVPTASGIAVFLGKGDGTFEAPLVSPGPIGLITVTDLNKDGKKDLIIAGEGLPLTVMLGKGDGTFQAPVKYSVPGGTSTRAIVADFNLDGKLDVAVGTFAMVDVFFGDGTGKFPAAPATFELGSQVNALATSDFNGDKKPDLAVSVKGGYVVTLLHQ